LVGLTVVTLFSGCASQPRTGGADMGDEVESITGPSTVIAGARVDDVRSVALGLARSKGWTIVTASDQKLVLRRPVDPDAPQAVELGLADNGAPPSVEVTSVFRQAPGGVSVTVNAQLVARVRGEGKDAGEPAERRIDYTESYRDNLLRSLESLRSTWAAHHQRVARALPPITTAGQAAAETAAELDRGDTAAGSRETPPLQSPVSPAATPTAWGAGPEEEAEPLVQAVAPPPRDEPVPRKATPVTESARAPVPPPVQSKTAGQPKPQVATPAKAQGTPQAKAQPVTAAKPKTATPAKGQSVTATTPKTATPTKAQAPTPTKAQAATPTKPKVPPATQTAAKPAGSPTPPVRTASPQKTQPPAAPVPVSSANNMLTLNRGAKTGSEVGNAERYAAQRGCKVRSGRTDVFRRDGASEYLRVYCTGDPAFVVKCTNGACKVLE
jgi:hypothetical protein